MRFDQILYGSEAERTRLLDMSRRMRWAEYIGAGMIIVAVAIGASTFGWAPVLPLTLATVVFATSARLAHRVRWPELVLGGCWAVAQLAGVATMFLAHGPSLYLLSIFIFPLLLACAVFPGRVAAVALFVTCSLMVLTAVLANPAMLSAVPFSLIFPLATAIACVFPAGAVQRLEVTSRESAVVDQLTGVLNRVALEHRVAELTHQAAHADSPIAIVLGDLDHFKAINDEHGHAAGDAVLRGVAQRLATTVGAAEPVYRLGGEEFVILLADTNVASAGALAERLRRAVGDEPVDGIPVTISLGVAGSAPPLSFDYEDLFGAADSALYAAKHAGRDLVRTQHRTGDRLPIGPALRLERRRPSAVAAMPEDVSSRWRERIDEEHAETGSWLVRDDVEREHLLDLNRRIHSSNRPAYAVAFGAVLASTFTYGWITLIPPVLAALVYNLVEHRLDRVRRRPEYVLGLIWLATQTANAMGMSLARFHTHDVPLMAPVLLVIMLVGSSAAFTRRGVMVGVAYTGVLVVAASLAMNASLAIANPGLVAIPAALCAATALVGYAAGRSAVEHRSAAVVDPLTGLFTRAALAARAAELAHHATTTGQQVAVIVADLDHFKAINDQHGHAVGDKVLQEAGYRLRKRLRAFEAAYRVGGEEFVILLPGVSLDEARAVAERACSAIHDTPLGDVAATMSFGVAATAPGQPFDYGHCFREADDALYEAKRSGRDCVRSAAAAGTLAA
jgi:diguanylate cyclase (GGDEF)-like protein